MNRFLLPLGLFVVLLGFLAIGLNLNPREIPSPLVGKPAPPFTLPMLADPSRQFSSEEMKGQVWLLNVWASWCVACRQEHPVVMEYAKQVGIPVIGLDYRDQRADALRWLEQFGDPYRVTLSDTDGRVAIDYGVYGVPESYLIDQAGIIRYKQIGVLTPEIFEQKIKPVVKEMQR